MAVFGRNAAMHQWFKWACDECIASLNSLAPLWHVALSVCVCVAFFLYLSVCAWHSICITFSIGHFACVCATLCGLLSIEIEGRGEWGIGRKRRRDRKSWKRDRGKYGKSRNCLLQLKREARRAFANVIRAKRLWIDATSEVRVTVKYPVADWTTGMNMFTYFGLSDWGNSFKTENTEKSPQWGKVSCFCLPSHSLCFLLFYATVLFILLLFFPTSF